MMDGCLLQNGKRRRRRIYTQVESKVHKFSFWGLLIQIYLAGIPPTVIDVLLALLPPETFRALTRVAGPWAAALVTRPPGLTFGTAARYRTGTTVTS